MERSPTEITTARRNLAQRIERFIDSIEKGDREPTRLEASHLAAAIGCLRQDLCPDGETWVLYAEKGWRPELVNPAGETLGVRRLRETLVEAVGEMGTQHNGH